MPEDSRGGRSCRDIFIYKESVKRKEEKGINVRREGGAEERYASRRCREGGRGRCVKIRRVKIS